MEQQTPIPHKSRMKPREGQNAPFSHSWFGESGGSRFSIYFALDFRVSCFHVSSVSRCLELVMKLPPSFLTYYMKLNGVHLVIPSISNSVFKQAFKLTLKLQEINNYTFRSNLQLFFTASSHFEIPSLGCKLQRVKILSVELGRVTVLFPTQANPRTTD